MGSQTAPLDLTLNELKSQIQGHSNLEGLYFIEECNHMFAVTHNFISFIMTLLSLGNLVLICLGI